MHVKITPSRLLAAPYTDTELRPLRHTRVQPAVPAVAELREPLGQGVHGRLVVLTEDELGARLLRDTLPTPVSKVTVRRLR